MTPRLLKQEYPNLYFLSNNEFPSQEEQNFFKELSLVDQRNIMNTLYDSNIGTSDDDIYFLDKDDTFFDNKHWKKVLEKNVPSFLNLCEVNVPTFSNSCVNQRNEEEPVSSVGVVGKIINDLITNALSQVIEH